MSYGVDRLSIEPIQDPPRPAPRPAIEEDRPAQHAFNQVVDRHVQQQQRRMQINAQVLAALQVISLIVSARLLLLLAVCFGFVLALLAAQAQTIPSIAVLVAWSVLTVLPLVALDYRSRTPPAPQYQGAR